MQYLSLLLLQFSPRQLYVWVCHHAQGLRAVLWRRLLAAMLTAMMTTRLMLTQQLLTEVLLSWQLLLGWHRLTREVVTLLLLLHSQLLSHELMSGVLVVGLVREMPVGVTPATAPCLRCVSISLMPLLPVIVTSLCITWG